LLEATPQTATLLLDDYGKTKGVNRRLAQIGIYDVQISFASPQIIPAKTLFTSANGILLTNDNAIQAETAGQITAQLRTLERGYANIKPDEIIFINTSIKDVLQSAKIISVIQTALDDESDGEYRPRVNAAYENQTLFGTAAYIRKILMEIPQIIQVYPYPASILGENSLNLGLGYPIIYIETSDGNLSQNLTNSILGKLNACGTLCGGEITVLPCKFCNFSLEIITQQTPISEIISVVKHAANEYLSTKRPYVANIDEIDNSAVSSYEIDLLVRNAVRDERAGEVASVLLFANSKRIIGNYVLQRGEIPAPDVEIRS
jgi:hypothetical protein